MNEELKDCLKDFCDTECKDKTKCFTDKCEIYITLMLEKNDKKMTHNI